MISSYTHLLQVESSARDRYLQNFVALLRASVLGFALCFLSSCFQMSERKIGKNGTEWREVGR